MSVEENKELVRRWMAEIDKADPAIVAQYIADDYLDHNPPPYPGLPAGPEGVSPAPPQQPPRGAPPRRGCTAYWRPAPSRRRSQPLFHRGATGLRPAPSTLARYLLTYA